MREGGEVNTQIKLFDFEKSDIRQNNRRQVNYLKAQHGILTHRSTASTPNWIALIPIEQDKFKSIGQIMAESCRLYDDANMIGYGSTELEAVIQALELNGKEKS